MVGIFFGPLTDKAIRRRIFDSVPDSIDAIEMYVAEHNSDSQPFQLTAVASGQGLRKLAPGESPSQQSPTKLRRFTGSGF